METPQNLRETQKRTIWSQRWRWMAASYTTCAPYPSLLRKATDFVTIGIVSHCLRACGWILGPNKTAASLHAQWHTLLTCLSAVVPPQTVRALTCLQASQYWGCLFYCHSLSTPLLTTSCFIHAITWFKMLTLTALWRTMTQRHPNTFTHTVYVAYWWRIEEKRMKV